jgi:glutamine synthetase adenylyltransferase
VKDIAVLQKWAVEIMDLLSGQTELGNAFVTDARLRPDGREGLLVNTLDAHRYSSATRAALGNQALTRTRFVAGNSKVGLDYQKLASTLANFDKPTCPGRFRRGGRKRSHGCASESNGNAPRPENRR